MKKLTKAILVLFLAMGAAVAASLLLDIPGGKKFKRYCSYPDMKALMDAEKDDITATGERGGQVGREECKVRKC